MAIGTSGASDPGPSSGRLSRRSFLDLMLSIATLGWAGSVVYPLVEYFRTPPQEADEPDSVVAAKFADLRPNTGVVFKFGSEPGLLVLGANGELRAFSAVCTHLDCTVQYKPDLERIHCACHNGLYDMSGRNVSGPPPRPLRQYRVARNGDDVVVYRT